MMLIWVIPISVTVNSETTLTKLTVAYKSTYYVSPDVNCD